MTTLPTCRTIPETARLLRCSTAHVHHLANTGRLRRRRITKRHTLILAPSPALPPDAPREQTVPDRLTPAETAAILHSSVKYVKRLCWNGRLQYTKPSPRKTLISADSLKQLLTGKTPGE